MVNRLRNLLIAVAVIVLTAGFAVANHIKHDQVSLATLSQESVPWEVAQHNGRPTILEFYADWCASCRAMSPLLADLKHSFGEEINFAMLNVDNPRWLPELNQYRVNGIPHFVFLDAENHPQAQAIGEQPRPIVEEHLIALLNPATGPVEDTGSLDDLTVGKNSPLQPVQPRSVQPRSHG
ncbi:MAG: thioredoxin family protein [Synechococcales cyanobacterium]